jgi:hypothetical protein
LLLYGGYSLVSSIWLFLDRPEHRALKVISIGVVSIMIFGIILERFNKKEVTDISDLEHQLNYDRGRESLYRASQPICGELGLKTPTSDGQLSTTSNALYFEVGKVPHYTYLFIRNKDSDVEINERNIAMMFQTRLLQMETARELPLSKNPMGYLYAGRYFCSLLVMSVVTIGPYVQINLALATDYACELYLRGKTADNILDKTDMEI